MWIVLKATSVYFLNLAVDIFENSQGPQNLYLTESYLEFHT